MKRVDGTAVSIYEYKCRRCQEVFTPTIEEIFAFLVAKMWNLNKSQEEIEEQIRTFGKEKENDEELLVDTAQLFEVHICNDAGRGLADLIGCEPPRKIKISNRTWRGKYRKLVPPVSNRR